MAKLKFFEYDPDESLRKLKIEEEWINIEAEQKKLEVLKEELIELELALKNGEIKRKEVLEKLEIKFEEQSVNDQDSEISKLRVQNHNLTSEIGEYQKEKLEIENTIDKILSKNNTVKLADQIKNLKIQIDKKREQLDEFENQKNEAFNNMQAEKEENTAKTDKIFSLKKQIDYLKGGAVDLIKKKEMENSSRILEEINKSSFKDKVIGPLYEFISLNDPKWYKVASMVLSKGLTNYIVFNGEDKIKLYNIFNKLKIDYTVSQMRTKNGYNNLHTNKSYKTLLSVLDIKDPVVSNQLITMFNIEQIILIENRDLAHKTISENPNNVDYAYTLSGDKIKLLNGYLSDFRQRDDGYYWFEDKTSKLRKLEMELNSIIINDKHKQHFYLFFVKNDQI